VFCAMSDGLAARWPVTLRQAQSERNNCFYSLATGTAVVRIVSGEIDLCHNRLRQPAGVAGLSDVNGGSHPPFTIIHHAYPQPISRKSLYWPDNKSAVSAGVTRPTWLTLTFRP